MLRRIGLRALVLAYFIDLIMVFTCSTMEVTTLSQLGLVVGAFALIPLGLAAACAQGDLDDEAQKALVTATS